MRRRDFIAGLGGTAAWSVMGRAQQCERIRRVGVLMGFDENDLEAKAFLSAFTQGLAELGWTDGRNVRMHVRWAAGNVDRIRAFAKELVGLQPDVILSQLPPVTAALHGETQTIPIIFVMVGDPVGEPPSSSRRPPIAARACGRDCSGLHRSSVSAELVGQAINR
jgi:putative tryptophan/tyrosine transport system substrate-binding protein